MLASPARRTALLALGALLAGLLLTGVVTVPAQASAGCLQETGLPNSCDDTSPPVFSAANVTVTVPQGGSPASVVAMATYADADPDPLTFQCKLDAGAFGACGPYAGLANGDHTLVARAIDSHDQPVAACEGPLCLLYNETAPDYTEVQTHFTVSPDGGGTTPPTSGPNGAPETQIGGGPRDRITPGTPVTLSRKVVVTLTSSEPARFNCAINAKKVKCRPGVNVLKKLRPGPQVLVAQAVDQAGNFDATPASLTFYVPINLRPSQGRGWRKVKSHGAYAGDYVATRARGAVLVAGRVTGVHEVRLIAPTGRRFGKVAVRVGNGRWHKVSLKSAKGKKVQVFEISAPGTKPLSGAIQVKALKVPRGGVVAVDAIVAR